MDRRGESDISMLITHRPTPPSPTFPTTPSPGPDLFTTRLGFYSQDSDEQATPRRMRLSKNFGRSIENRSRSNSTSTDKGKEPIRGHPAEDMSNFGREHYVPHYNRTSPYLSPDKTRPSTADGNLNARSRNRGSILVAASDALGLKFGRRKPPVRQLPSPVILPDVIEISARRDAEDEERNHLKQMAAQAIGLSPFMVSTDHQSREDGTTDEDYEEEHRASGSQNEPSSISDSLPNVGGWSPHGSSLSVSVASQQPPPSRYRSGSVSHRHSNSLTLAPIPPFPTSVAALSSFKQRIGDYPKYYPPSSLRLFALSKNWKTRYLILSSPATLVTRSQAPAVSYLHLFKSSNREEKELERLEINEDSVVFVSEEEVGGKRHVIKVGGADVGAMKKEYTHEEGGHIMWLLQIPDPAEAQRWITDIKNAILGQRTVRAGLIPRTLGNNEPRGDMDVMLTIRAQGLVTSPNPSSRNSQALSPINTSANDSKGTYASSISSHSVRSQATVPKSPTSGAVQTLKGLFTNRPRSASRAASIESERPLSRESTSNEDSFTSRGSNLLSMLRSSTPDSQSVTSNLGPPAVRNLPLSGPVTTIERRIDRKILSERQPVQWVTTDPTPTTTNKERVTRGFSLQPPPRRRWVSMGGTSEAENQDITTNIAVNGNSSRRASLTLSIASTERAETEPPSSPGHLSAFRIGTPEQRPRAPSLQSVSTYASADNATSLASASTKRSSGTRSARRWSRQSTLPHRLTPPTEPPPAIPTLRTSIDNHPSIPDGAVTPTSVQSSDKSVVSSLPSFSKRASGSSARSVNSSSTSHSNVVPVSSTNFNLGSVSLRTTGSHRTSMPPPRPAPTFAPPPAPTENHQDVLKPLENMPTTTTTKSSFRNSVANRTFRLSTIAAPKPPPSSTLPPRPDEPEFKIHRRSLSGSSTTNMNTHSTKLETIPGSPIPPSKVMNPFPPPAGPLPPTPIFPPANGLSSHSIPPKRATSIKQRLRGLSASSVPAKDQGIKSPSPRPFMSISTAVPPHSVPPPPATPIAEKITLFQNDPSFLQMHTPVLQPLPPPQALLSALAVEEEVPEVTSLSPPPRRGSKQLFETELEPFRVPAPAEPRVEELTTDVPRHLSLSRPGSIISNHSHHSHHSHQSQNLDVDQEDGDWESPRDETSPEQLSELSEVSPDETRHLSLSRPGSLRDLSV